MIRVFACLFAVLASSAQAERLRLAVTTSFHNSGLADVLLPEIKADIGLDVELLVVGTGQALRLGQAGDVDAILVHSKAAEDAFVAAGYGTHRREIMYNDFVILGPVSDPGTIADQPSAAAAFESIATAKADFVSRGDNSGTHLKELSLWEDSGLDVDALGSWYKEVGSGMGASLNTAAALDAYILSDRASWLNFDNKRDLAILFSGDPVLFNQYAYIPVDPTRHAHVNVEAAAKLETWLTADAARTLINGYAIEGEALFVFNAQ